MITEDRVSFETAKLLKEKGFPQKYDIYHSMVYNEEDYEDEYEVQRMVVETKFVKAGTLSSYSVGVPDPKCYCPTLQMAMKWLREKYNIFFNINYFHLDVGSKWTYLTIWLPYKNGCEFSVEGFDIEIIYEKAIKYCLENLI